MSSARQCYAVTPSADPQPIVFQGLYIGTTGDVVITDLEGNTVTFVGVPAGKDLPICGTHVTADTTASDIVAYVRS